MAEQVIRQNTKGGKVWYLPNMLTYARILAVPIIAGLLMYGGEAARWVALVVYIIAAITDFFDGYLARIWQQQSALGRMLDPIADKVLVSVVLIVLAADGVLSGGHLWAAFIITAREVLVSGLREFLGELRVSVPVTKIAKWKTTVQLIAIGMLIAGPAGDVLIPGFTKAGIVMLWIAAALTLYTGYDYFRAGLRHVVDGE
ncbi:CDP-diacylglycerol--glycerol-3-phosphate 3-phosphatidyltransferase [Aestuariivirga litoralis]|uniref:CDP-diacylglycerol--glycerol-3-phosphate 3-phosphatidyltransferase n=1 Tax=Aestuariivirga litoralis TaxID=2650924 RepID=UPI0018C6AD60|nr:CDP-diacylglycerol--glycerol-3-phosphate 3-phosphatidyltransferase [Aestuariivirga litoralis]MBG1230959.1 CDP-diacylglycerol--glycerol-3-phosphate 3-phosphatidyltransferase [Aestuariivirga litoralis]